MADVADFLATHGVRYAVIGAMAAAVHGVVRASLDADARAVIDLDRESLDLALLRRLAQRFGRETVEAVELLVGTVG